MKNTLHSRRSPLLARVLGLALGCLLGITAHAQQLTDTPALHWATTWSMSPSSLPPAEDTADAFTNQTLRQIIHTSAGGEQVRLRLSNTHGNKPLRVGAVTVALHDSGSRIVPGSVQKLTFSQRSSFTIPRGAVVFSDPLPFTVPAMSNLAISLFLPEGSGTVTTHLAAQQTGYVSGAGDFTESAEIPDATEIVVWNYITAVDIGRREPISTIVTLGDSITDGVGSTRDANNRWPNYLMRRLSAAPDLPAYAIANAGLSGNRVLHENSPRFGENLQARLERDVLALSNVTHVVLLEGINDIGMAVMFPAEEVSADDIIAGYRQVIARLKARDIKVIGATLTPFEGAGYYREEGERKRQLVNTWIRNGGEFDAVIDFEDAVMDLTNPLQIISSFTEDNLHPNDAGYEAMARVIDLNLFR
jgi:lysophospholipase L1-like esterase